MTALLAEVPIYYPPLPEQRAIAHILGTLDDKIECNRRMNRTLEEMARGIFKSWFVDFDPVKAKMEGRRPVGMDDETAALFPDELVPSELGLIPRGWRAESLGKYIAIHDSRRVPLSKRVREQRHGPYPYYGAAGIVDYVDDHLFDGVYVLLAEDGSVVSESGHPTVQYVWGKFWANNHAHVLQGKNGVSTEYLKLFLDRTHILPYVTGAVQPKLNQGNMKKVPFIKPKDKVLKRFDGFVSAFFRQIRANVDESLTAAALRDSLLPKLISGKIRTI